MMHWLNGSPDREVFSRALEDEPDARATYMKTRMISVYKLPECVRQNLEHVLQSSFDIKLIEQKVNRYLREGNKIAKLQPLIGRTSAAYFSWAGPEAVRYKLVMFVLDSPDAAYSLLTQMDATPLQPYIREAAHARGMFMRYPRGPKLADDDTVGPMVRKAAHSAVDLLVRATIVKDAQELLGAELPPAAFMQLVRASTQPWGVFELKVWRNMAALASHVRGTTPEVTREELGVTLAAFSGSSTPIASYESHRETLGKKLRARLDAVESARSDRGDGDASKSADTGAETSRELVAELLRSRKDLPLSVRQVREHSRSLSALLRKSGIPDLKLIRELLSHHYHPETIVRELRDQLRPERPGRSTPQPSAPLSDLAALPRMPATFIRFYQDTNGRNDVTTWLQQQPLEIQELVNGKLDLIAQGGRGKGLTRGGNETLKGICEWRIKAPKATLRVYYLPAHRETGEITVLMIGHKSEQAEDLKEAHRRAEVVRVQHAAPGEGEARDGHASGQ